LKYIFHEATDSNGEVRAAIRSVRTGINPAPTLRNELSLDCAARKKSPEIDLMGHTHPRESRSRSGIDIAGVEGTPEPLLYTRAKGRCDPYVWTFLKGGPNAGESPEAAAVREVQEEAGVLAEVVKSIPGSLEGGTTENVYFLMRPLKETGKLDEETAADTGAVR
jgi:NUDIX domain